jgi:hypothetical protein
MPDKPWYTSVTLWGALVMAVAFILGHFGFGITASEQIQITNLLTIIATSVGGIVGLIMVIIGRKNTGNQIKSLRLTVARQTSFINSNPTSDRKKDISIPQTFMDLSNLVLGKETTTVLSVGIFASTPEGKKMLEAVKEAMSGEKGKLLIEQFKKLGDNPSI